MVIGAIIIIGAEAQGISPVPQLERLVAIDGPLGCVEVMGRSVVGRMVERFLAADVEVVTIIAHAQVALPSFSHSSDKLAVHILDDMRYGLSQTLKDYAEKGIEFAFVAQQNVYTECDLIDWIWFHRGTHQAITRACDRDGAVDFWVTDCAKGEDVDLSLLLEKTERFDGPSYFTSEYVNQVTTPWDFRRLVTDTFRGHCDCVLRAKRFVPVFGSSQAPTFTGVRASSLLRT